MNRLYGLLYATFYASVVPTILISPLPPTLFSCLHYAFASAPTLIPLPPVAQKFTSSSPPSDILYRKTPGPFPTALARALILSSSSATPPDLLGVEAACQRQQQWTFTGRPPELLFNDFQTMPDWLPLNICPTRGPIVWKLAPLDLCGWY